MRPFQKALFVALACHAALLFAVRLREARRDQPISLEVSMAGGGSESSSPLLAEAEEAPELNPPEITPPPVPAPTPEPNLEPAPVVEAVPQVEPVVTTAPTAAPLSLPQPVAQAKPAKPRAARSASTRAASAAGASSGAAGASSGRGENTSAQPRYRSNPRPEYPPESRRAGQQGVVLLLVDVTAEGRVGDLRIARSSGFPALDQAALEAVRRWTFEPARALGLAVASRAEVPVRFSLAM